MRYQIDPLFACFHADASLNPASRLKLFARQLAGNGLKFIRYIYHGHQAIVSSASRLNWRLFYAQGHPNALIDFQSYCATGYMVVPGLLSEPEVCSVMSALMAGPEVRNQDLFKVSGLRGLLLSLLKNTIFFQRSGFGMQDKLCNYRYVRNAYQVLCAHLTVWRKIVDVAGGWMNSHVCAEGVELYTTLATGDNHSNSSFHLDAYPPDSCKVLIYLSDVLQPDDGCTQVLLPDGQALSLLGPAGTAVFFRASQVLHRGVSPVHDRHCLCVTLGPSLFKSWIRPNRYLNGIYRRFSFLP